MRLTRRRTVRRPLPLLLAGVMALLLALPLSSAALTSAAQAAGPRPAVASAATPFADLPGTYRQSDTSARPLGYDRIGVRRNDTWYLRDALDGGPNRSYREATGGFYPVAGDTDGDGEGSVSLFRDGTWLISDHEQALPRIVRFGIRGDIPVLGDWDGDGMATIGIFRRGQWFLRNSNTSGPSAPFTFGRPGDQPVVGDWNGDGRTDIGIKRGNVWYERDAPSAGLSSRSFTYGLNGDVPVAGDWDHDGRDTPGLFRSGTWYLRRGNFPSPYQVVRFGLPGDAPVVRRTQGLAPGVTHDVVRNPSAPWVAQVVNVDLSAASSPDAVLSNESLAGTEPVSSMSRRAGAVVGINGDYFLGNGRPVHLYAQDGRLVQQPTQLGRAFSLDASGTQFATGYPDLRNVLSTSTATGTATGTATLNLPQMNLGEPTGDAAAGYSAAGSALQTPPDNYCYAGLVEAGSRSVKPDGTISTPMSVTGIRCGGARPLVPASGMVIAVDPFRAGATFVRSLARGQGVTLTSELGFPGAADTIGGTPLLVINGSVVDSEVTGSGPFFDRAPRTAVGVTGDGKLLIVVVDGRSSGFSRGMTLRELATLMRDLGAQQAMNLDGGGSTTMFLNGLVANRPSDGYERAVSTALVVLPGADARQTDLQNTAAPLPVPAPQLRNRTWTDGPAETDPASAGGLADALLRKGVPVSGELRRTADAFRQSR